ncbi:MAG: threonylcarbamoyl-AMP synthase, partial [Acidobacteria bacterium]
MGQVVHIDPLKPDRDALELIARVIRNGGVIVYPTDTIYGLGCSPANSAAVERVLEIKQRSAQKGLLLLVPGMEAVPQLCSKLPAVFQQLASRFWPGPVTFLLPGRPELSPLVRGERGLVGLRSPDSAYLRLLMEMIPGPLVSTSANLSGDRPSGGIRELAESFLTHVDLFVDGGDAAESVASTVVDASVTPPAVVRAGVWAARV